MACRHIPVLQFRRIRQFWPVPAAPLAGALLICISAVSVSCCAHLSAPDVWQIAVLGSAASPLVTLRGCACCQLLFRAEPQGVDF